eukprot:CAMPEP_0118986512 /NCGR_PEP_ID=MMETSP1173-20130426/42275_1 /TAXON_ID=1034831 /ORGANISM="Rhizochromulina marina cf, Strain CCMP1243" /LENGTH=322 /DNA_ID=CAMNT_0006937299 /DNA_START=209 /DNA_END=1177 /DNA_ORIENTATION=-
MGHIFTVVRLEFLEFDEALLELEVLYTVAESIHGHWWEVLQELSVDGPVHKARRVAKCELLHRGRAGICHGQGSVAGEEVLRRAWEDGRGAVDRLGPAIDEGGQVPPVLDAAGLVHVQDQEVVDRAVSFSEKVVHVQEVEVAPPVEPVTVVREPLGGVLVPLVVVACARLGVLSAWAQSQNVPNPGAGGDNCFATLYRNAQGQSSKALFDSMRCRTAFNLGAPVLMMLVPLVHEAEPLPAHEGRRPPALVSVAEPRVGRSYGRCARFHCANAEQLVECTLLPRRGRRQRQPRPDQVVEDMGPIVCLGRVQVSGPPGLPLGGQ